MLKEHKTAVIEDDNEIQILASGSAVGYCRENRYKF